MSEYSVIKESKKPYTKVDLISDLHELGIKSGDIVLVHSALSKIGWVIGSAVSVVEALIEIIGEEGTIVMPSFSGENSDPANWQNPPVPSEWREVIRAHMPPFNPVLTPTREMGKIVDLFRHYPGVIRSNHPQVSFCAYGKLATELLSNHQLTPGFGKESPLQRLYDKKAKVLLLGVGYGNCTCMHLGEVWLENKKWTSTGASILKDNKTQWVEFQEIEYDDSDFERIGETYEKTHAVKMGIVGQATARLLDIQSITGFAYEWIKKYRE